MSGALNYAPMMRSDGGVDQIAAKTPEARKRGPLLGEPAIADDVGDEDGGEFPRLAHCAPLGSRHISPSASPSPPIFDGRTAHARNSSVPGHQPGKAALGRQ